MDVSLNNWVPLITFSMGINNILFKGRLPYVFISPLLFYFMLKKLDFFLSFLKLDFLDFIKLRPK